MSKHSASPSEREIPRRRLGRSGRAGRVRFAPAALVGGILATAAVALSMNGTLAAFTAQITNSNNTAATGTLTMQEVGSAATCNSTDSTTVSVNAATCSTINKYGGSTVLVPGSTSTQTITIKNTGTVPANTFNLTPGTCTQGTNGTVNGTATDLCSQMTVKLVQTVGSTNTTIINNATPAAMKTNGAYTLTVPVAAGATVTYAFTITMPSTLDNTYQGLSVSQPLVWQFTS